ACAWSPSIPGTSPRPRPRAERKPAAARAIRCNLPPSRRNKVPPRACVRRSGAQVVGHPGALCESQRSSHQRDGARDFVSGPRAPKRRLCSDQARCHRSLSFISAKAGMQVCRPNLGRRFRGSERSRLSDSNSCCDETGERIMASYGPELIQIMRAVLDEVMTKIPVEQVTPGLKAHMAQIILKAAAEGQTSYDGLLASASDQIQTILSMLT